MKKSDKANVALAVALAAVLGGSVALTTIDTKESSPIQTMIFEQEKMRTAWLLGTCAENAGNLETCERTWDRRGYCRCLTRDESTLPNETDKVNVNTGSKWKFRLCRPGPTLDQTLLPQVLIQNPEDGNPPGWICSNIAAQVTDDRSVISYRGSLEDALESGCGFDISPGSWACCPRCAIWDNGCPPCSALCKYGNDWPGNESECNGGSP